MTSPKDNRGKPGQLGRAALAYAKRGWRVFPCHPRDKRPLISAWQVEATTQIPKVMKWWLKWPLANIAVVCGKDSGIVVADIDIEHGGFETWNDLQDIHGRADTLEATTGSKGQHSIFQAPDQPLRSGVGTFGPGIDSRAEGGYIIVAPSIHPNGDPYAWTNPISPEPVPLWLLKLWPLTSSGRVVPTTSGQPNWVAAALANGINEGGRNSTAARLAGYFHHQGTPADVIIALLSPWAERCSPPMDHGELRSVVSSITSRYRVKSKIIKNLRQADWEVRLDV